MSAGAFGIYRYESDNVQIGGANAIMPIKLQPETIQLELGGASNEQASGTVTLPLRAKARGSNRELGVKARTVSLAWVVNPPDGYQAEGTIVVPILTKALWDAVDEGITTGTYLGVAVTVIGKQPELKL